MYKGSRTTHTFELDDRQANLLAGYLWECLDKLEPRTDTSVSVDLGPDMQVIAQIFTKELFKSIGVDFPGYTGTDYLQPIKKDNKKH